MRFTVLVAADLYGNKVNLELSFAGVPSLAELYRTVETTFAVESSALRPAGHPFVPFKVSRFHVFDDRTQQWAELLNPTQLVDYCQVYAFQRDAGETQKQIPPARLPTASRISQSVTTTGSRTNAGGVASSPTSPFAAPASYASLTPLVNDAVAQHHSPTALSSHRSPNREHTSVPRGVVPSHSFPESATFDQKVRIVFDEVDVNQNRVIELDEFRRSMRILNIDLNAATVADLFQRADGDRDGVVSITDWQQFCANYPTMLDSLYYRSKEFWEDHKKKVAVEQRKQALEEARIKERQASQLALEAKRDLQEQEQRLHNQEGELQQKLLLERECRANSLEAKKELEKQAFEKTEREREVANGKERERQRQQQVSDAQKNTEASERRVASQEAELARAQEKERQLEAMLADARRETERQGRALHVASDDLQQVRGREQQCLSMLTDAHRDLQRLQDSVVEAEKDLSHRAAHDRDADAVLSESQRETARSAHRRDEEERALQLQRERDAHHLRVHTEAARVIEDAERALIAVEQDYAEYLGRRQQVEQQELPLIEQEIRLREQRFSLEQMESRLKNEAATFQSVAGRAAARVADLSGSQRNYSPPRR